jgi:hypothetical protein
MDSDGKDDFIAACDRAIQELDAIIASLAPDGFTDEVHNE